MQINLQQKVLLDDLKQLTKRVLGVTFNKSCKFKFVIESIVKK